MNKRAATIRPGTVLGMRVYEYGLPRSTLLGSSRLIGAAASYLSVGAKAHWN